MARIPGETIERLKSEVSVQRLAEARGVVLKKHGADLIGRCPFHEDHTPSLIVTPAKNLWHCMGACQVGGTVIDWVMRAEGVSFRHAVELLQADYLPLAASSSVPPAKHSTVKKLPTALEHVEDPTDPNFIICKDKTTGKKIRKPKPADWPANKTEACDTCQTAADVVVVGGIAYVVYRCVRMLPSLLPPLWWTIPENVLIP